MKKLLSILLVIGIIIASFSFSVIASPSYEAYIGDIGYSTFADAVKTANASDSAKTITLSSNISKTGDNAQFELTNSMTIDFNGYKLTLDGNQAFLVTGAAQVTIRNGSLLTNFIGTQSRYIFKTQNSDATMNLSDFVIEMKNVTPETGASIYAEKGEINLQNIAYNYISERTSYGAVLGSSNTSVLNVKNSIFNCDYSAPLFFYGTSSATTNIYNSTFNQVNEYTLFSQASKKVDFLSLVPSCCNLSWNNYNTGFTVACQHSYNSSEICVNCGSPKKDFGDVNADGSVDSKDALSLKKYFAEIDTNINTTNAKVSTGSALGLKDLLKIRKYLSGEVNQLNPVLDINTDDGDVAKSIHFKYSTTSASDTSTTDRAVLMLPKGYSKSGAPTRLVIDVHGYSVVIDERMTYINSPTYKYVSSFVHNGFAVLNVQALDLGHCGGKYAIQAIINAYKYVIDNYNICTDGVYVNGNSMGGISSINLVCSNEIPVLAQTLHYPISSTYRQTYTHGWIASLRKLTAKYSGFSYDEYNAINGTDYTLSTFPFTSDKDNPSQAELDLYQYNFFDNIANNYSIFKYTNIISESGKTFNSGFEDFLSEFDSTKVDEMYEKITVNYPVPVFFTQCLNDTDKNVWAQKLVRAMQRGNSQVTYKWYEGTKHGGSIGPTTTFTTKDGTVITAEESAYTLSKYFLDFEESLNK